MELINSYLKNNVIEYQDDDDYDDDDSIKLKQFYNLFIDLKHKYDLNKNEIDELKLKHKNELNELENYIQLVKNLTEEREKITLEYKEENNKLKNKIKILSQNNNSSEDDLSEGTIDLLIQEGFSDIVTLPNHEKIAVLLAERSKLLRELENNKNSDFDDRSDYETQLINLKNTLIQINNDYKMSERKIEELENEIETLKSANKKLSREIDSYKQRGGSTTSVNGSYRSLDNLDNVNSDSLEQINKLNNEIKSLNDENERLKVEISKIKSNPNSKLTNGLTNSSDYSQLQQENTTLKSEIDKLYDDISKLEKDVRTYKEENLRLKDENENLLDEIDWIKSTKVSTSQTNISSINNGSNNTLNDELKVENERLKQEIDVLNNELDDLLYYKANYERLNFDYEKLKQKSMDSLLSQTPATSTSTLALNALNKLSGSHTQLAHADSTSSNKNIQLELDWIRRENEKLLIENEQLQLKLKEQRESYEQLKKDSLIKDDRLNKFIEQVEKKSNNALPEEIVNLQKEIARVEGNLNDQKKKYDMLRDEYDEKQKEFHEINEDLWAKLRNAQQNYDETIEIIKAKDEDIHNLVKEIEDLRKKQKELENEINDLENKLRDVSSNLELTETKLKSADLEIKQLKKDNQLITEQKANEKNKYESNINELKSNIKNLQLTLGNKENEVNDLVKDKDLLMSQSESSHKKLLQEYMDLQQKNTQLNEQRNKLLKDNDELTIAIREKEQQIRRYETDFSQLNHRYDLENREKCDVIDRYSHLEQVANKNWEKISELSEKLQKSESERSKLELKLKELVALEDQCKQMNLDLIEKRDSISNLLEKNGKLELQLIDVQRQLTDSQKRLQQSENQSVELNALKTDILHKTEDYIKYKHEFENEKSKREKCETKLNDIRDEYKKQKQKVKKLNDENTKLQHDLIDSRNQLNSYKARFESFADRTHTELEKTTTLQDELNETRKKLEHAELKCASYSQKFEILLKKYENRKSKYKTKMERFWEYFQREKAKYKELLANAQSDLMSTKTSLEKEAEFKNKQETSYQQIIEEKRTLLASMVDKDAKMRDMKRQNMLLNSKIKLLEEEMENLHEKIDVTLKERNKLRKEVHMGIAPLSEPISRSMSPTISTVSTQINTNTNYVEPFKTSSIGLNHSINTNGSKTMNNSMNSNNNNNNNHNNINNTNDNYYSHSVYANNWERFKLSDSMKFTNNNDMSSTHSAGLTTNGNAFDLSINSILAGGPVNDFNSTNTTPRSFR